MSDLRDRITAVQQAHTIRLDYSNPRFGDCRWQADIPDPGPCQCQRWDGHDSPHRCCCGQETADA